MNEAKLKVIEGIKVYTEKNRITKLSAANVDGAL
jgi:hypothetical protein